MEPVPWDKIHGQSMHVTHPRVAALEKAQRDGAWQWDALGCGRVTIEYWTVGNFVFQSSDSGITKKYLTFFLMVLFLASRSIYQSIVLVLLVYDRSHINKSQIFTWNLLHLALPGISRGKCLESWQSRCNVSQLNLQTVLRMLHICMLYLIFFCIFNHAWTSSRCNTLS